ncbi:Nn.00g047170.m01.CDS01 [Neocucurbitaria sp. VM-36]
MAGETMQAMPMSPRQSPAEIGSAAVQWACTRRGRMMVLTMLLLVVFLGMTGMRNHKAISSKYHDISSHYQWRPYLPHLPSIIHSPFKTPSNTTLQLENGDISHVPANLKKTTPNFHLLMPAERDTDGFCKTTLSAMLLNYPPPTAVNLYTAFETDIQWERNILNTTLNYLSNAKYVQDEDLVLIVDGQQSWFQLPSDVIVTQYKRLLEDANVRLLERYGVTEDGFQKFNQTIVFGADKMCQSDDMACKYVPSSILPDDIYGKEMGRRIADMPAKFINSKMVMGPANDLRALYLAALTKFEDNRSQSQTVQSVIATLFSEQQLRRDAIEQGKKPTGEKLKDLLAGATSTKSNTAADRQRDNANAALPNATQHEFSIGLDYTHTLFQPLIYCTEDELVPLVHDNSTDLSKYHHPDSWTQYLSLPPVLDETKPPFWRPDLVRHNPSPNEKSAYIDKLEFSMDLDKLPKRKSPWNKIPLVQNTYTGAVPAILLNTPMWNTGADHPPTANITFFSLWYSPHKRALLRNYFRTPQSPNGYHNSLVGGDRAWDMRGGRGGVWTATEQVWLPWGEVDGVCGTLSQINEVFSDGKGVWLHEKEDDAEDQRLMQENELHIKIEEDRRKVEEKARNEEEQREREKKNAEELRKTEQEKKEKERLDRERKEGEENDDADDESKEAEETAQFIQDKIESEEKWGGQEGSVFDAGNGVKIARRWVS